VSQTTAQHHAHYIGSGWMVYSASVFNFVSQALIKPELKLDQCGLHISQRLHAGCGASTSTCTT
jgi:hypothetical protein